VEDIFLMALEYSCVKPNESKEKAKNYRNRVQMKKRG
jgi:hypothetical protein